MKIGADRFIDKVEPSLAAKHATQRYVRGVSDVDMWNFDILLADLIVFGCDWHLQNGFCTPWHLDKDEWHAILTKIRDGFAKRNNSGGPKPTKAAWKLLRDNFTYFWD